MPPLKHARDEAFVQILFKGGITANDAYEQAGFTKHTGNAARLKNRPDVAERLRELQEKAAVKAIKTVADIVEQLEEDRQFARELEAPAAAISATMGQAKVLGLLSEKVEHTGKDGGPIEVADADLARLIAFTLTKTTQEA